MGCTTNSRTEPVHQKADYCRVPGKIYGYVFGYVYRNIRLGALYYKKNGGPDETRTRDLRRDRPAF